MLTCSDGGILKGMIGRNNLTDLLILAATKFSLGLKPVNVYSNSVRIELGLDVMSETCKGVSEIIKKTQK